MTSRYRLSLLSLLTTLGLAALSLMGLVALLSHPAPLDANDLAPTPTLTAEDFVLQAGIACQISGDAGLPPCHADFVADSIPPSQFGVESEVECRSGLASFYPCRNIDLVALLPLSTFESGQLNDIWGWTDPETGAEIVIIGAELGTVFVDISNPSEPIFLGQLPNTSTARRSFWKDVKTYQNYAYVVADFAGQFGMQVFDLTKLRGEGTAPQTFSADFVYDQFGSAHNIMINADTGFAYAVGVSSGQEICNMGMHVVDLNSNPLEPTFAGCVDEDGYVHDTQCVVYFGPDALYQGREICFNFNEDDLVIVDVTEKDSPVQLSKVTYVGARYTHQGWLTPDQSYLLLDDESDERADFINTTTYLWDVTDLTAPQQIGLHRASTRASDHNQYERWGYTFQANYQAGLRILDLARIDEGELTEVAYFDTFPTGDASNYNGAWSSYPYFESGIVAVSGIEQGLFLLRPTSLSLQRFDVNEMSEVKAFPGSVVTHSIELLSLGEVDTYTVDIETGVWTTTLVSDLTISGSQFDRLPILVQVEAPPQNNAADRFTVTLRAQSNPDDVVTVVGVTEVDTSPDISADIVEQPVGVLEGGIITRQLRIVNSGLISDQFSITLLPGEWEVSAAVTQTAVLQPQADETVSFQQRIGAGAIDSFSVQIGSSMTGTISKTVDITTTLALTHEVSTFDPVFGVGNQVLIEQAISLRNLGVVTDSYAVELLSTTWPVTFSTALLEDVPPRERSDFVIVDISAGDGVTNTVTLGFTSVRSGETVALEIESQVYKRYLPIIDWQD